MGVHFNEECDLSVTGETTGTRYFGGHNDCCSDCLLNETRADLDELYLNFVYEESAFEATSGSGTFANNSASISSGDVYCRPFCDSMYTTGLMYPDAWLSLYDEDFPTSYNGFTDEVDDTGAQVMDGANTVPYVVDLTQYNPTVSNYYFDTATTTRNCFKGKFCYNCINYKWPGYEMSVDPDTSTTIMRMSRGDLRIIESSDTEYGFSYVTNSKSEIEFKTASLNTELDHATWGNTRQSFGKYYIQNVDNAYGFKIYALHDGSGSIAFELLHTTTETIRHSGYDKAFWWPVHNFIMVRQLDKITWDGYGLNADSVDVSATPANYGPKWQFEPFSTGPIHIDGNILIEGRFCNGMLAVYRESTRHGDDRVSMYSWSDNHFYTQVEVTYTKTNDVSSFVSFGTDGVLIWEENSKTGKSIGTDGTETTISTVEITDSDLNDDFTALATGDTYLRFIQARPDPDNPTENPPVYAFFTDYELFTVTLDVANTKVVLDPVVTLDTRIKLYQPLDIGHTFLANMVAHAGDTWPETDTDFYTTGSVCFIKIDGTGAIDCLELQTAETMFD